eukprot:TRINITY_DN775947_c0_g1_i1.p1 TRINITY_DN775947_c0_g1~~TRINITY_DN775947_c0_g1_i1.p1  ORF type:complete len:161 (+),score=25.47 TRINITY_DN775947_c0_g1_i1:107-589(+)
MCKFHFALILLVIVGYAWASNPKMSYEICSSKSAPTKLTAVTIDPNPMEYAKNTTVTLTGELMTTIDQGAYFEMKIYYQGFRVSQRKGSICQNSVISMPFGVGHVYVNGLSCPQQPGKLNLVEKASMEIHPVKGKYGIRLEVFNSDGTQLACATLKMPIG